MNDSKIQNLLAAAAVTLSVGFCAAWLSGWLLLLDNASFLTRAAVLAVSLTLAGGSVFLLRRNRRAEHRAAVRYFQTLCRPDRQLADDQLDVVGPPPPTPQPWRDIASLVSDALQRLGQRIGELQQNCASLEVRSRRAAAKVEQISRIVSAIDEPILAVDECNAIVLANRSARELLQIGDESAEAQLLEQAVSCQKLVQLLTASRRHKAVAQRNDELEIARADGPSQWYRATAVKLAAADGDDDAESPASGAVAVLRGIDDRKALEKRNAEFVSAVSHEMKTPLAGIKAYVELLADGDAEDDATREEFLNVINGQTDRLQRLVDNLLNLARIEAGVVNVSKRPRSLNELLEEALRVVQPAAEAKNIQLTGELSPLYLGVLADRDLMLQAAINLLSNAVKYTRPGGRVTLRSRMADDHVRFEVQDTGVGLSEDDCRRVFEKFYRVKKDKDMAQGTGLGLPLAKHIVEDVHSGQLTVESALGQGSTFVVTLPCAAEGPGG